MANSPPAPQFNVAIVKQILSGDLIVLRGQPKGGPPPERTLALTNIVAPKLARRPGNDGVESKDEPYAWEAREYMRKKLVGRKVHFSVDLKTAGGREYGSIFIVDESGNLETAENVSESLVKEGLAKVKAKSGLEKLVELEEAAKAAGKGVHGPPEQLQAHVRNIHWGVESPMALVDKFDKKPIQAVIEHVRDGSTVRAFLLPDVYYVTLMISGIKSPMFKMGDDGQASGSDPFADEAKYFTESRLLQRDVQIVLESASNNNFVGSVIHPNGDIAELLLSQGFAKCADWSMRGVVAGQAKLRQAEAAAKEKKLKIWKDYVSNAIPIPESDRHFSGKVVEIVNADALVVKKGDGNNQKIFLASIRPPKFPEDKDKQADNKPKRVVRPLYDIPYMFEAREFLRTKLIGKKVQVTLDYIQPASGNYPEKRCCTVMLGDVNIGEALVSHGLATVVKYRQDDDQRSSRYDELQVAEAKAQKSLKGLYSKKEFTAQRVNDITGDATKAKSLLTSLKRGGKVEAVVEFVFSGSRFRLYLKRDGCLLTFLLGGIQCPRASRPAPGGGQIEAEPYGEEAMLFAKEMCLQREVNIEFDTCDRAGNFVGWLFVDDKNFSTLLVEEGLATVHSLADKSQYGDKLREAEKRAKDKRLKLWKDYTEAQESEEPEIIEEKEKIDRKISYEKVVLTEVTSELTVFVQPVNKGTELEGLMSQIRQEFTTSPPLSGAFSPKRGDICAAKFSYDGVWYRAKVEKILPGSRAQVIYIDYGNREEVPFTSCASLPSAFQSPHAYAKEYGIAFAVLPKDLEIRKEAIQELLSLATEQELLMNIEFSQGNLSFVTLSLEDSKKDIIKHLVEDGFLMSAPRREARFKEMVQAYNEAEKAARKKHLNIWEYGDITEDDALEFGYAQPRA